MTDEIEWIDDTNRERAYKDLAVHGTCFSKVLGQRRWYVPFKSVVKTKMDEVAVYVVKEGASDE